MTSQAAIDSLIQKGNFEARAALAVAEAIDTAVTELQIVTVPILDGRLAELRAETRISLIELRADLEKRLVELRADLENKLVELRADLEKKIEACKAELVRWVFIVMVGNVALSAGATAILNALQHH
jgi:hypothetical protein